EGSVHGQSWPVLSLATATEQEVVVQVNGKRRGSITLALEATEDDARKAANALPAVTTILAGREPKRVIYVPRKIINLVV
ncbi:MAG: hypothetical protein ACYCZZ_02950, partial [Minisyncoccota bacterium]